MNSEDLKRRCDGVFDGLGRAIDWVRDVRPSAQRLDREADGLTEKLRRSRNLCRRLGAAAGRPLSIGVFGMSQAGKSYLISTLARGSHGKLITALDGKAFDFIGDINPPGGGKEATGLVTRFTRRKNDTPRGYPIELTLFSEADLIKVLGNSFFNDFDRERVTVNTEPEHIRQHLALFEGRRRPEPTGGLDEDGVVDLMDYFDRRFAKSMEPFKDDFWPTVVDLAPRLSAADRGALLSPLWGEIGELTEAYVRLQKALASLSNARTIYVPLDALVVPKADGDGFEWNERSIINVDVLNSLGKDDADPLTVLPLVDGEALPESRIARSVLTALTAEMTFVLADAPVATLLERVDLLDFPGYRGRLAVESLDGVRRELKEDAADPVAQLLLRGKVAYLFERYTEDQEMNVLIMCTRCDQQIEVTALAPVVDSWVQATQGETAEERGARPAGLVWVLTQLDRRLEPKPGQTETQQRQEWSYMIHITLLERFSQCDWLHDWVGGRPFDNLFLVRKPGFLGSVIDTVDYEERGFRSGEEERLASLRGMFVEDPNVVKHVADAGDAWDAVLALNDGGMARLAAHLERAAIEGTKLVRIADQIARVADEIVDHRLGPHYFAGGADEFERKKAIAVQVASAVEEHLDSFGDLLFFMQPPSEELRRLYLRADARGDAGAEAGGEGGGAETPRSRRGLVRLPSKAATAKTEVIAAPGGRAALFAKTVMSAWIKRLRDLPENSDLLRHLGLPREVLQALTDEFVTASDRARLEARLVEALRPLEDKRSTTRGRIVDQQVLLARMVVNGFVDSLGIEETPLAERPPSRIDGRKIFEPPPPIPDGALPELPADEVEYSGAYVLDWLEAFAKLAIQNAGHSGGREISPEQNQRLSEIISSLRGKRDL